MSLLIGQSTQVLLRNSEITNKFPWLLDLMDSQPKFKKENLITLPSEIQIWFRDIYNQVLTEAIHEWKPRSKKALKVLLKEERIKCQLCGTPNRYIFYIVNRQNGNELNVGRDCVNKFGMISTHDMKDMERSAIRVFNLAELVKRFPDIRGIVEQWDTFLDKQEILIPFSLEKDYNELGEKAQAIYENALEKGASVEIEARLDEILKIRELIVSEIAEYVKNNRDKKFIPTQGMIRWIRTQPDGYKTIEMLKENGLITWKTAHRITYPIFTNSLIAPFNSLLESINFTIQEYNDLNTKPSFILVSNKNDNILLSCPYKQFVLQFGGPLFNESDNLFTLDKLIMISHLYGEGSIYNALGHISNMFIIKDIEVKGIDIEFDEFIVNDKQASRYRVCNELKNFTNKYKGLVFFDDLELISQAKSDIQRYKPCTYEELSDRQRAMLRNG